MTDPQIYSQHGDAGGSFLGGLLVLFGVTALLMHFALIPSVALWKLWPLLFVWIGLVKLTQPGSRVSGLAYLLLGGAVEAYYFGYLPLQWSALWPGLAILVGLWMLGSRGKRHKKPRQPRAPAGPGPSGREPLRVDLTMSGRHDQLDGREFAGADVRCWCSGYELDLRGSTMVGDEAYLDVDVSMGGIAVRVPPSWRVEVEATNPFLGGVENSTHGGEGTTPQRLIVRGRVFMGGVEISN